ncbi:MAG: lipopolysaccharide heptosyltransferase II [Candidatus Aureabacteria bacterium]|nr:lipopolysaccharide heptosyltransferase II [Candidatus Auribacterota bacterium]
MKIVIRGANWLGDAVITIPAVRAIRRLFPGALLTMLTAENLAGLWEMEGSADQVLPVRRPAGVGEKARVIRALRTGNYDLGILFPNSFESALWFLLGGVRERVGYTTCGRRLLLNRPVTPPASGGHQVHRYLALARTLGQVGPSQPPELFVPRVLTEDAEKRLAEKGFAPDTPLIGINPGSTYGTAKCWPVGRFAGLAALLRARLGAGIVVVGGTQEHALADTLCRGAHAGIVNMAGRTTIPELAALISRCDLFVSNDTGPMHLAAAVGTPVVAIIGPTNAGATGPLGKHILLKKDVSCAPCMKRECPTDHKCMELIAVEEVYRAVDTLLRDTR